MRRAALFVTRLFRFGVVLLRIAYAYACLARRHRGAPSLTERARWLHQSSRLTLEVFGVDYHSRGALPESGLLVSNHLSYLDILVLSALTPAVFVSKAEVRHWPVFGWCARMAGTIFVKRERRSDVVPASEKIREVLATGQLVVLFPEGTSTNGERILPFKSSLLEPARGGEHPLTVAYIAYELPGGSVANDICFWGDMTFLPHFLNLVAKENIVARVRFESVKQRATDRKELARQLHAQISALKSAS